MLVLLGEIYKTPVVYLGVLHTDGAIMPCAGSLLALFAAMDRLNHTETNNKISLPEAR